MPQAAAFDPEYFANILRDEVEKLANERYGGTSDDALGRAFAFWCIKTISPELSDENAELARSICEGEGGSGDFDVDGAWTDDENFYLLQAKYQIPKFPLTEDEHFKAILFPADPAEELSRAFFALHDELGNARQTNPKIIRLLSLYRTAKEQNKRIELVVAISGGPKKPLNKAIRKCNEKFDEDRMRFRKHNCSLYDQTKLNQTFSTNNLPRPGIINLNTAEKFVLKNIDDSIYALTATVNATELIRIRKENGLSIYHANFRFLLKGARGVAAPKILATLEDELERQNFWRYNNGVTISCRKLTPNQVVGLESNSWRVEGFQVVNGLQTMETLYRSKDKDWFDGVRLLIRVIPTSENDGDSEHTQLLEEHIAEYSNSQSPITARDLRANDPVQIFLERELADIYDIQYVRKAGESPSGRPARKVVSNELAAQAALSFWHGKSNEAKGAKKLLFEKKTSARPGFYEDIFIDDQTTSEYILLPALLLYSQKTMVRKIRDKRSRGLHKALNLLALAVVGDAFKRKIHLSSSPSRNSAVRSKLIDVIKKTDALSENQINRLWKPLFADLLKVVQSRRARQARSEDVSIDSVAPRNVIVNMKYTDPSIRSEIWRRRNVRKLPGVLRSIFEL